MAKKTKVNELPDFEKDSVTNAVINTNSSAFSARRDQLQKLKDKDGEIQQMKSDIEELKKIIKKLGSK
jgi:DNA anti-recombination protein RmuC|tara:strand:+ start:1946 stop:2149 length:204 start_codon:yes stop_codon:yes gene_type:complete